MFKKFQYCSVILFGTLFANVEAAATLNLNYNIEFNDEMGCLDITATLPTNDNNELILNIPQRGVSPLEIKPNFTKEIVVSPFIKKLIFDSPSEVNINYQLCMDNPKHHIDLPIIEKHFLQLMALNALILPLQRENQDSKISIELKTLPKNFKFASSEGFIKSNKIHFYGSLNEFSTFVLAGGTQFQSFQIGSRPVFAFSSIETIPFPDERMTKIKKVALFQRKLVRDHNNTPLLLTFIETPEFSSSLARHFKNTLSLSCPAKKNEEQIITVFAHEFFHDFLGWQLRSGHRHGELLWFIEGIDDYFGTATAYQSGAISQKTYLEKINNLLKDYYLSPIAHLPYTKLAEKHQEDLHYNVIAQIRGHLAALMLQGSSKKSLEKESTTDILKNILKIKCPEGYCTLTPLLVHKHFETKLNPSKFKQILKFIETGNNLSLPPKLNGNELNLKTISVLYPKVSFDLISFFNNHEIQNIQPESPEYNAGLRNGMKVVQYNFYLHDPYRKITIAAKMNDKIELIEFFPETEYAEIPQYINTYGEGMGHPLK